MQKKSSSYKRTAKRSGLLESEVYRRMDRVEHQVASDEPVVGEGSREERLDHILGGGVNARDDHQREHGERDDEDLQDHPDDLAELSLPAPARNQAAQIVKAALPHYPSILRSTKAHIAGSAEAMRKSRQ